MSGYGDPQWLRLGREAAARALYEAWHPMRTDNGFTDASPAWLDLAHGERARYLDAAQKACEAYHESTLETSRAAVAAFVTPEGDRSTMSGQEDERRSP